MGARHSLPEDPVKDVAGASNVAEHVWRSGQEGYHTYRIPAMVRSTKGTLLAFAEGRRAGSHDAGAIHMLLRRSTDGGRTWSPQALIWADGENTCGNPAPVVDERSGTIWLLMTWNLGSDLESRIMNGTSKDVRQVYVTCSKDDGLSWSTPECISSSTREPHWRWYATGPCNGIQLKAKAHQEHRGRLVVPCNHSDHSEPSRHPYRSHVVYSDDYGASWKLGGVHTDRTNESSVAELSDGSVLQSMRSYHGMQTRAMAISPDGGVSWGHLYHAHGIDTPVCQGCVLRFESNPDNLGGPCLLQACPTGKSRSHLTVFASFDEGRAWLHAWLVCKGSSAYSCMVDLGCGRFGVLYEKDKGSVITFVTASLDDFKRTKVRDRGQASEIGCVSQ